MMADFTFEELVQAAQKLSPQQKSELARRLDSSSTTSQPTREELIAELRNLQASGAFKHLDSLRDKYANPASKDLTEEQLSDDIRAASTEWESELDKFFGNND
jgi:hypothetical protein